MSSSRSNDCEVKCLKPGLTAADLNDCQVNWAASDLTAGCLFFLLLLFSLLCSCVKSPYVTTASVSCTICFAKSSLLSRTWKVLGLIMIGAGRYCLRWRVQLWRGGTGCLTQTSLRIWHWTWWEAYTAWARKMLENEQKAVNRCWAVQLVDVSLHFDRTISS